LAAEDTKARSSRRQLPITGCAHKTGVVGDAFVRAVLAALDVAAERGSATGLDRRHDFQLVEADAPGVGLSPRRPVGAKDVGDLEGRPRHAALGQAGGVRFVSLMSSRSSGLLMSRTVLTATRV
jgi:hypothetical protein